MSRAKSQCYMTVAVFLIALLPPALCFATESPGPTQPQDVLLADMNPAVDPGIDFFVYANGAWLARNPIPATESTRSAG